MNTCDIKLRVTSNFIISTWRNDPNEWLTHKTQQNSKHTKSNSVGSEVTGKKVTLQATSLRPVFCLKRLVIYIYDAFSPFKLAEEMCPISAPHDTVLI